MTDLRTVVFGFGVVEIMISFIAVILALYYYNVSTHSFWRNQKVPGPKPIPFFGNVFDIMLFKTSVGEKNRDLYRAWKHEPFIGFFYGRTPVLLINDPILLKDILVKDFAAFSDRNVLLNEDVDPLSANLTSIVGHRWKELRSRFSPAFTSAKLRRMYCLLSECSDRFENYIDNTITNVDVVECKELMAKYTTDVIGACLFGIDMSAIGDDSSKFRNMGRETFEPSVLGSVKRVVRDYSPALFKFLQLTLFPRDLTESFKGAFAEVVEYRKKNNVVQQDFMDLLIKIWKTLDPPDFELTDDLLTAQAFIFFAAGFETSSLTTSFALYELAQREDYQEKLRTEIRETLKKYDGKIPYDAIKEMKYLDKVVRETLRKHPPVTSLTRVSVKDCKIPGTDVHIPEGVRIFIPLLGLHYDPQYYRNPEDFDPEHFDEEAVQQRPQMAYLPFGEGPRHCIGIRFANYQVKMGLITILKNHKVSPCVKTQIPYTIDRHTIILAAMGGVHLKFTRAP